MYLVQVENNIKNTQYRGSFETNDEAVLWIQEQITKLSWGHSARRVVKESIPYDVSLVESEDTETDEFGNEFIYVNLKAEYTYDGPTEITGVGTTEEDRLIRKSNAQIKITEWKKFRSFGEDVEIFFTALINERGYDQAQKDILQSSVELLTIMGELRFGRIAKAKSLIAVLTADDSLFFQDDINAVVEFINDFLIEIA
jgi:hypothetical protein